MHYAHTHAHAYTRASTHTHIHTHTHPDTHIYIYTPDAYPVFKKSRRVVENGEENDDDDLYLGRAKRRRSELLDRPADGVVSVDGDENGQPDGGRVQHRPQGPDVDDDNISV